MQGPEYVVLGPIRLFPDTFLIYVIWVYEADVIVPFFWNSCTFILHDLNRRERMRKHIISRAMVLYTNGRSKYTFIQNTQR